MNRHLFFLGVFFFCIIEDGIADKKVDEKQSRLVDFVNKNYEYYAKLIGNFEADNVKVYNRSFPSSNSDIEFYMSQCSKPSIPKLKKIRGKMIMKISENSDSEKEVNLFLADHLQLFKAIYEDVRTCMLKNFYLKLHERILKEQIAIHSEAIAAKYHPYSEKNEPKQLKCVSSAMSEIELLEESSNDRISSCSLFDKEPANESAYADCIHKATTEAFIKSANLVSDCDKCIEGLEL